MERRFAIVAALAVTVVVGFVLLSMGATSFRSGEAGERDPGAPPAAPVADLASGRNESFPFDDDYDDGDDDWDGPEQTSSPHSGDASAGDLAAPEQPSSPYS